MKESYEAFKCNECGHIWIDPFDIDDRYAEIPTCTDCDSDNVVIFDGEVPKDIEDSFLEFLKENGLDKESEDE